MRLSEIQSISTPKFKKWFKGSQVVDSAGNPLPCFHSTTSTFEKFHPLSHFGTRLAATSRAKDLKSIDHKMMEVYLKITRPLHFEDSGQNGQFSINDVIDSTPESLWEDMSSDELDRLQEEDGPWAEQFFIEYLSDFGYDGLVYKNKVEHIGSLSWVIFDPSQVWIVRGNE